MNCVIVLMLIIGIVYATKKPTSIFEWNYMEFEYPSKEDEEQAIRSGEYSKNGTCPFGLAPYKDRMFIGTPRWHTNTPATLSYFWLNSTSKSPKLYPYPSWEANSQSTPEGHVSVFRPYVDVCDRLWVADTGYYDTFGDFISIHPLALFIYDLKTDKLIRRFEFPKALRTSRFWLVTITVDVEKDYCDKAYAYLAEIIAGQLYMYSYEENKAWASESAYFKQDPIHSDFASHGLEYQFQDNLVGLALTEAGSDGYKTLYMNQLCAFYEWSLSTKFTHNSTLTQDPKFFKNIKFEGNRGQDTQASAAAYDVKTKVLFWGLVKKNGIGCWNTQDKLSSNSVEVVTSDADTIYYIPDIKLDDDRNLYFLSNSFPAYGYNQGWNGSKTHIRIFKEKVDDLIKHTKCDKSG